MKKNCKGDKERLLIIIDKDVFDVTNFQLQHPGGRLALRLLKNQDCSELFRAVGHSKHAWNLLHRLKVSDENEMQSPPPTTMERNWQKFFVFILSIIATTVTFWSYWDLICNRDEKSNIESFKILIYEIMSSIYLPTQGGLAIYLLADYFLVTECSTNFELLKRAGYSLQYVLFCMMTIYIFSGPILGIIFWTFLQDSQPYISFSLISKTILIYASADMLFESTHKWMHYKMPSWHLMHHVTIFPTACSGLVFDLPDYALEFWAAKFPIVIILGTDVLGVRDGFACVLCLGFAILIDICNHDAWMKTAHFYHHVSVGASFGTFPFQFNHSKRPPGKNNLDHPLKYLLELALLKET